MASNAEVQSLFQQFTEAHKRLNEAVSIKKEDEASRKTEDIKEVIRRISARNIDGEIFAEAAVKLTSIGLLLDYGLALEGTFAIDVPGSAPHKQSAGLKKGSVVTITDRGLITHPKVLETIVIAAQSEKIPYQYKKIPSGRTDASSIHLTKAGIPSGTIAAPCRYIHGPVAITTVEDLENSIKLVKAFIVHISNS